MSTIELTNIADELARLWDEEQGKDKIRACLFNLIVFTPKSERGPFYEEMIRSVISKFPSRIIQITSDETSGDEYLRTSVSTETVGEGELQIFCEIIRIEVGGSLKERVPYIVLPHILPDLPVHLLWTQDPAEENAVLPFLEPFATRIIFDSESTRDLKKYAEALLAMDRCFHCEIGDLNWSALSGWRQIFNGTFDSPETLRQLFLSKTLHITYNKSTSAYQKHTEVEAAYLQGWLAAQLGWKFDGFERQEGNIRLHYTRPGGGVTVWLAPREEEKLPPGALLEVEIDSSENKGHYVFRRHPGTRQVFVQYSDHDHCDLPSCSYLVGVQEGQEIVEEIFYQKAGDHYGNMLKVLSEIPWSTS